MNKIVIELILLQKNNFNQNIFNTLSVLELYDFFINIT